MQHETQLETIAKACSALGHPVRVRVLITLLAAQAQETGPQETGPQDADTAQNRGVFFGALAQQLGLAPSSLTHHLREMEAGGLISRQAQGRATLITAQTAQLQAMIAAVSALCCPTAPACR